MNLFLKKKKKEKDVSLGFAPFDSPATEFEAIAHLREALARQVDCQVLMTNYRKNEDPFCNLLTMHPVLDASGALVSPRLARKYTLLNLALDLSLSAASPTTRAVKPSFPNRLGRLLEN